MMVDILKWFLLMILGLFVVWVLAGGPKRAEEKGVRPIIRGPGSIGEQTNLPSVRNFPGNQN